MLRVTYIGIALKNGQTLEGVTDLSKTLDRINNNGKFPHRNDGSFFKNREGKLPSKAPEHYREYVHPTPGECGPGPQRIIVGKTGEKYYTPDHYQSFIQIE